MKTNSLTSTLNPIQQTTGRSRLLNVGRLFLATMSVALVSFAGAPKALAAGPNGTYEFESASGSLRYDGDSIDIPQSIVKKLANVVDGEIVITNNTLKLNKNATVKVVRNFADDFDVDVEASVTGPSSLVLVKTEPRVFTGKTTSPIVTTFEGEIFGEDFSGELRTKVAARVEGKTLTVVIRFSGEAAGEEFSGRITLTAKR